MIINNRYLQLWVCLLFIPVSTKQLNAQRIPAINFILTNALCEQDETDKYNRVGMSILSTKTRRLDADPNEFLTVALLKYLPKKFDVNRLGYGDLETARHRPGSINRNSGLIAGELRSRGIYQNVLDRIMIPWEKIEENPDVYPKELKKRIYNSVTNLDVDNNQFSAMKLDNFLFDSLQARRVLDNNYIAVFDFSKYSPLNMVQERRARAFSRIGSILTFGIVKYNPSAGQNKQRILYGMKAKGHVYLYRINLLSEFDAVRNFYFKKNFPATAEGLQVTEPELNVTLIETKKFRTKVMAFSSGNEAWAKKDVFNRMENNIMHQSFGRLENSVPEMNVRRTFVNGRTLKIELGSKEGVYRNQRLLVYEQLDKGNGRIVSKPVAAVRLRKIADNEEDRSEGALVELSKVYQYQGKKIDDGMYMRQFNEAGFEFGYEATFNAALKSLFHSGKISYDLSHELGMTQLRIFAKTMSNSNQLADNWMKDAGILNEGTELSGGSIKPADSNAQNATARMASVIPALSEIGFSYEFNFLRSVFLRAEASTMGFRIKFDNDGMIAAVGGKSEQETITDVKLDGYTGKVLLGYFVSPSISIYGGASKSWFDMKVKSATETTTLDLQGSSPLNQSFYIGLKINL